MIIQQETTVVYGLRKCQGEYYDVGNKQMTKYLAPEKLYKNRPKITENDLLYEYSDAYSFKMEESDIKELPIKDGNLSNADYISYLQKVYLEPIGKERYIDNWIGYVGLWFIANNKLIYGLPTVIIFTKRKQLGLNEKDKEAIRKEEAKEQNKKIMNTLLDSSLNEILDKYGLTKKNGEVIHFKDRQYIKEFVKKALEETLLKELKENGIEVRLNNHWNVLTESTTIAYLKDMKLTE